MNQTNDNKIHILKSVNGQSTFCPYSIEINQESLTATIKGFNEDQTDKEINLKNIESLRKNLNLNYKFAQKDHDEDAKDHNSKFFELCSQSMGIQLND